LNLSREDVQDILNLLDALPVDEFDLQTERFHLTLRRCGDGTWTQSSDGAKATEGAQAVAEPGGDVTAGGTQAAGLGEVRSPLPGTFYRAPKPGAPPFVEVGSQVGEETVVAIVETMKMMNPIPAGLRGTVAAIELADAEFADHDTVLMRIAPERP
jgi:acetyl-CoA carboxylase biotin carboxyl carrier protein